MFFTQHGLHLTGGWSATWSAVQTGWSAPLTRTVRPYLFSTRALIHEQLTHALYTWTLYHGLALLEHASSCHLRIMVYIHDILIYQASFAFV